VAIEPVNEMNNADSVSGFSDGGERFAITNKSAHYHHQSDLCLNDDYSCHGPVEQVNSQAKESTICIPSWIHVFLSPPSHPHVEHKPPLSLIWRNPPPKKYVIIIIGVQRGSTRSRINYCQK
jgi:hypothetical protein